MKKFIAITTLLLAAILLMGCSMYHFAVTGEGNIYSKGTQTITATLQEEAAKWKTSVSPSDFTLDDGLKGKEITNVEYVTEKQIILTISGTLETLSSNSYEYYNINAQKSALKNSNTAEILVTVRMNPPMLTVTHNQRMGQTSKLNCETTYRVPYGNFIVENCTTENVTLLSTSGTIESVDAGTNYITIVVKDFASTDDEPVAKVKIAACCTTFNIDLEVEVGQKGYDYTSYELIK